jgi:hypothetical protein
MRIDHLGFLVSEAGPEPLAGQHWRWQGAEPYASIVRRPVGEVDVGQLVG